MAFSRIARPTAGFSSKKIVQLLGDDGVHQGADLAVAQLGLGLALELGLGQLDGDDAGQALPAVLAGDLLVVLEDASIFLP